MKKILQTLRYLIRSTKLMTFVGLVCILGSLIFTEVIFDRSNSYYHAVSSRQSVTLTAPVDVVAGIFALLTGLVFFIVTFKVALANGISRKTFLVANLPAAWIAAAAFSIFNLVVVKVHGLFWPIATIIGWNYPQIGWVELLILQFALYFLLTTTGWFITLAYYRSNVPVKWAISVAPFVLFGLLRVAQTRSGYPIFEAIWEYLLWSLRLDRAPFTLLAYAAILCGLVYLLLRRAPLKD